MREPAIAALGGPQTFGGQAARRMSELYPELGAVVYFQSSEELYASDGVWRATASCVPEQMSKTGFHLSAHRRLLAANGTMHVVADVRHAYHCALLGKPGTELRDIVKVYGHTGSINQSRRWLETELPGATIQVVPSHSLGAATAVAIGDGSRAAVGSLELAAELDLAVLAEEIDGGSVARYWAVSPRPLRSPKPTRLVVAGRPRDGLSDLVAWLRDAGYKQRSVWSQPVGDALLNYDIVSCFDGSGRLEDVVEVVDRCDGLWLAGAYEARDRED